jgi:hypothetical protein
MAMLSWTKRKGNHSKDWDVKEGVGRNETGGGWIGWSLVISSQLSAADATVLVIPGRLQEGVMSFVLALYPIEYSYPQ